MIFFSESEEDHIASMQLVSKYKFPVLNISQFYARPGTAAAKMQKLNSKIVKERSSEMTKLFESYRTNEHLNGELYFHPHI